jgi:ESCRT-I complex subunit TSG101
MAERVIDECRAREPPNVDQVVVAPSVVENQLYDLVTEDLGIEDTIYALARALDGEKITLEAFLKVSFLVGREWSVTDARCM